VVTSKETVMPLPTRARLVAALPALLLCAASLPAAQTPYVAIVVQAEAEARCKPSTDPKLYQTNRLTQGARILVLEERNDGWLAIQPPTGSFSWISSTQIERIVPTQANWVVKNDSVPVLIGGDVVNVRPTVEGVRLARGTQVHVISTQEVHDTDGSVYLPIDPPAGEVRYIRAEAVKPDPTPVVPTPAVTVRAADPATAANFTTVSRTAGTDESLSIPSQTGAAVPALPANATPWQQAEYYERLGRWNDAIQIYDQLGKQLQSSHPDWAAFAQKRAAYLRQGGKAPVNWSPTSAATDARATTTSTFRPEVQQPPIPQVHLSPPADPNPPAAAPPSQQTASWSSPPQVQTQAQASQTPANSGSGRLVRSGYYNKSEAQYRLETQNPSTPFLYATPGPGVDLEQYVDRNVILFGTMEYNGDLRCYCIVVTRVQPM
jgi:hypothetical protein